MNHPQLGGMGDRKVIHNAEIHIEGNVIESYYNLIQITNISRIYAGPIPKPPIPIMPVIIAAILIILGLITFILNSFSGLIPVAGGALILWAIFRDKIQLYAINIMLNCGSTYSFTSENPDNINNIYAVLSRIIIDNNDTTNMIINFGDGSIINNSENAHIN